MNKREKVLRLLQILQLRSKLEDDTEDRRSTMSEMVETACDMLSTVSTEFAEGIMQNGEEISDQMEQFCADDKAIAEHAFQLYIEVYDELYTEDEIDRLIKMFLSPEMQKIEQAVILVNARLSREYGDTEECIAETLQ